MQLLQRRFPYEILISLVFIVLLTLAWVPHTYADSLVGNITVNNNGTDQCYAFTSTPGFNVTSGNDVNITVSNNDPMVAVTVSGPGISTQLDSSGRGAGPNYIKTFQLGAITTLTKLSFTPVPIDSSSSPALTSDCPAGYTPNSAYILINPVTPPAAPAPVAPTPTAPTKSSTSMPTPVPAATPATPTPTVAATTTTSPKITAVTPKQPDNTKVTKSPAISDTSQAAISFSLAAILLVVAFFLYRGVLPSRKLKNLLHLRRS